MAFFRRLLNEQPEEKKRELINQLKITATPDKKWSGGLYCLHPGLKNEIVILSFDGVEKQCVYMIDPITRRGMRLELGEVEYWMTREVMESKLKTQLEQDPCEWVDAFLLSENALLLADGGSSHKVDKLAIINPKQCELQKISSVPVDVAPVKGLAIREAIKINETEFVCLFDSGHGLGQFKLTEKGLECTDVIKLNSKEVEGYTSITRLAPNRYAAMRIERDENDKFQVYLDLIDKNKKGKLYVSDTFWNDSDPKIKKILGVSEKCLVIYEPDKNVSVCDLLEKVTTNYKFPFEFVTMMVYPNTNYLVGKNNEGTNVIFMFDLLTGNLRAAATEKDYSISVQPNGRIILSTKGDIQTFKNLDALHVYIKQHELVGKEAKQLLDGVLVKPVAKPIIPIEELMPMPKQVLSPRSRLFHEMFFTGVESKEQQREIVSPHV